jgi:gas vesicle protein
VGSVVARTEGWGANQRSLGPTGFRGLSSFTYGLSMSEEREQARMREHLAEMRRAARGLGKDFALEFGHLESEIDRMGRSTAKEAKYLARDIQSDLDDLRQKISGEIKAIPDRIAQAGSLLGQGTVRAAGAAKDVMNQAGHKAKSTTRNALATMAGVKRTPIKTWSPPEPAELPPPPEKKEP